MLIISALEWIDNYFGRCMGIFQLINTGMMLSLELVRKERDPNKQSACAKESDML
jgi:hypothetical protein